MTSALTIKTPRYLVLLLWAFALASPAQAASPGDALPEVARYALIIGNNAAGPGQEPLRFAERDADAFAGVLTNLGQWPEDHTQVLHTPDRQAALDALDDLTEQLHAEADAGRQTLFTFYYSGHARSSALDFGEDPLPLDDLKARLTALPSTVTLVVLDACRSGAFTRTKGATAVEDFSISSVKALSAKGLAVMTSSSAGELSQESEVLGGSFFTHHLLVGLRGAADANADGRVALGEAYRFAYDQTLISTARTAVGRQHVTFETRLAGQGALPLTAPGVHGSWLELHPDLVGDVLISTLDGPQPVVMAELHKVAGSPARIALPAGAYQGIVRRPDALGECEVTVPERGGAVLSDDRCIYTDPMEATTKGGGGFSWGSGWALELSLGLSGMAQTDYTRRLEDFGYEDQAPLGISSPLPQLTIGKAISPNLELLVSTRFLNFSDYELSNPEFDVSREFSFGAVGVRFLARGRLPLFGGVLVPYAQLGGGPAVARDTLKSTEGGRVSTEDKKTYWGYTVAGAAGLQLMPFDFLGLFAEIDASYAPVISNRLGDTHNHGGRSLFLGLRGVL